MPTCLGRILRPSSLKERRFFLSAFGSTSFRVPRALNPYALARRIRRAVTNSELDYFAALGQRARRRLEPDARHQSSLQRPADVETITPGL